jgi:SWI/SNF-related matrix-associated actin-dependent regulator 1 of chromatin subfamily A
VGIKFVLVGERIEASPTGFLGGELFATYRQAMGGGWKFDRATKAYRGTPSQVLAALKILGDKLPAYLGEGVKAALEGVKAERKAELAAADTRAAAVDEKLGELGHSLYPYQATGIRWLAGRPAALLADDMGLGKTLQALVSAPAGAPILVVCPAVAKGVWAREASKWRPDLTPVVLKGRKSFRWPAAGEMVVTNWDILPPELAAAPSGVVVVADEAHAAKNSKAARTKRFRAIAKAARKAGGRVWLLTGTPLLNRPPELWALLTAAGLEKQTFGSWPSFAKLMGGRQVTIRARGGRQIAVWEWDGRVAPQVPGMLQNAMLRRLKEDVLEDLPALRYESIDVNGLSATLKKQLDAALESIEAQLAAAEATADSTAELPAIPFERISAVATAVATAKIPALLALVEEHEEQGEPLVVFSAHRAPIDELAKREGWAVITGDTPAHRRSEIEDAFQAGKLRGVAATIQAGGVAITLTHASRAVFVDRLFTPALNAQARDRIYRIGQKRGVLITDLVAEHALDRRIYELLAQKEQLIAETVDAARRAGDEDVAAEDLALLDAAQASDLEAMIAEHEAALAKLEAELDAAEAAKAKAEAEAKMHERIAKRCGLWDLGDGSGSAPRRAARSDEERHAERAVKVLTAMDPDHAEKENQAGWSKADGWVGHALASLVDGGLSEAAWKMACNLVKKYHRQVGVC